MASILIWILAGTDIFVRITESIPGGEEGPWFNSLEGFLGTYAPPYPPRGIFGYICTSLPTGNISVTIFFNDIIFLEQKKKSLIFLPKLNRIS
jgi:hypothetical protein